MMTIKWVLRKVSTILVLVLSLIIINACGGGNNEANNDQSSDDTEAPSKPAGLSVNAIASSQMNLSWNNSTDNIGVQGYKVYKNGLYIKTVSVSSTSDN